MLGPEMDVEGSVHDTEMTFNELLTCNSYFDPRSTDTPANRYWVTGKTVTAESCVLFAPFRDSGLLGHDFINILQPKLRQSRSPRLQL